MHENPFYLKCSVCQAIYAFSWNLKVCIKCSGPLWIEIEDEFLKGKSEKIIAKSTSMWDYLAFFPFESYNDIVSLGEGGTPLLSLESFPHSMKLKNILIKDETRNPTGSFKDRQTAPYCNLARQRGFDSIVTMSSGNVAVSLACHATSNGLKSYEILPEWTPEGKISLIEAYGGIPLKTKTTSSESLYLATEKVCEKYHYYNGITAAKYSPMNIIGSKTIAYELYKAIKEPCNIFIGSGGGGGVTAIYHGLNELLRMGVIDTLPKLFSVQPSGCSPIYLSWKDDLSYSDTITKPFPGCNSIAAPLADDIPLDGFSAARALRATKGMAIIVSDEEIVNAQKLLSRSIGIFPEPAGAASLAGLIKAREEGKVDLSEKCIIIITGSGMKNIESIKQWSSQNSKKDENILLNIRKILEESNLS